MAVVRGAIGETPWGWTLGALGKDRRTARLTLVSDGKEYSIRFHEGRIVAASSPFPADTLPRIALTNQLIASVQTKVISLRIAAAPDADEFEAARLDASTTEKLRPRVLVQRAARTFVVDAGEFTIEDCEPMPDALAVDVETVVFAGARLNLNEDRLRFGLRHVPSRFFLSPRATPEALARFQFTPKESPLLETMRAATSLAELEANHRDIDPRGIQGVLYALAACDMLVELDLGFDEMAVGTPAFEGPLTRAITSLELEHVKRTETAERVPRSLIDTFQTGKVTLVRPNALSAHEVAKLIIERTLMIERGADHFTLLGVPIGASIEDIHAAYVELARNLSAKRLRELKIADRGLHAETVMAQIAIAFTVLTDRVRRAEYIDGLKAR